MSRSSLCWHLKIKGEDGGTACGRRLLSKLRRKRTSHIASCVALLWRQQQQQQQRQQSLQNSKPKKLGEAHARVSDLPGKLSKAYEVTVHHHSGEGGSGLHGINRNDNLEQALR